MRSLGTFIKIQPSNISSLRSHSVAIVHNSLGLIVDNFTIIVPFPCAIVFFKRRTSAIQTEILYQFILYFKWNLNFAYTLNFTNSKIKVILKVVNTCCTAGRRYHNIFPFQKDFSRLLSYRRWFDPCPPRCGPVVLYKSSHRGK